MTKLIYYFVEQVSLILLFLFFYANETNRKCARSAVTVRVFGNCYTKVFFGVCDNVVIVLRPQGFVTFHTFRKLRISGNSKRQNRGSVELWIGSFLWEMFTRSARQA